MVKVDKIQQTENWFFFCLSTVRIPFPLSFICTKSLIKIKANKANQVINTNGLWKTNLIHFWLTQGIRLTVNCFQTHILSTLINNKNIRYSPFHLLLFNLISCYTLYLWQMKKSKFMKWKIIIYLPTLDSYFIF